MKKQDKVLDKVFRFKDAFGRVWEVPLVAVWKDYERDHRHYYGKKPDVDQKDLETWFYEQWYWDMVERHGVIVKDLTGKQKDALLKKLMSHECYEAHEQPSFVPGKIEILPPVRRKTVES